MAATLLDGNRISREIKSEIADELRLLARSGLHPGLAVILVGDNPASEIYVRQKIKACEALGIYSEKHTLPNSATTRELLDIVESLNGRDEIDGMLVQLPLPAQVDSQAVLMAVDPAKDVDGLHPLNAGRLSTRRPSLVPVTPLGVMELLRRGGTAIEGAEAVVVGRSNLVGKPLAMLLLNQNATVTVCHSKTRNLATICRRADILVVAIGKPGFITRAYIKPGATVVDIGINRITDPAEFKRFFAGDPSREAEFVAKGSTLIGDVHPEAVEVAGAITPVPGGVGPLTIAMLMANTLTAAKLRRGSLAEAVPERLTC